MTQPAPLPFVWDGEAMRPPPAYARRADELFAIGATYVLSEVEDNRSAKSHRHYFALVREAWANLQDFDVINFPTPEHLRKWALIKAGYRDERTVVGRSKAEAARIAAFIRPMDSYALIVTHGTSVTVYTAQSQSEAAMGKRRFQESKDAVLQVLSERLGVSVTDLRRVAA